MTYQVSATISIRDRRQSTPSATMDRLGRRGRDGLSSRW